MIPKVIHYCWFGNARKPKLIRQCIASWKKHLPDYDIREWNESNFFEFNDFARDAYRLKKWAFVADYVRLKVLYEFGGIYLDTDMLIVKSLTPLLQYNFFAGNEEQDIVSAGIIGAVKLHPLIKEILGRYERIEIKTNLHTVTIPLIITDVLKSNRYLGENVKIFSSDFFYPLPNNTEYKLNQLRSFYSENTYSVHLWAGSWVDYKEFTYLERKMYRRALIAIVNSLQERQNWNRHYFRKIFRKLKSGINATH